MLNIDPSISLSLLVITEAIIGFLIISWVEPDRSHRVFLTKVFFWSFAIRIAYGLFFWFIVPILAEDTLNLSDGFFSDDSVSYDHVAAILSEDLHNGEFPELSTIPFPQARGYILLNTLIFFIFGHHVLAVRFFDSFLGALIPIFSFFLAKRLLSSPRWARLSTLLIAFYPEQILYCVVQLKEISLCFSIVFFLWALQKWAAKRSVSSLIGMVLSLSYTFMCRIYFGFPLLIAAFYLLFIQKRSANQPRKILMLVPIAASIGFVLVVAGYMVGEVTGVSFMESFSSDQFSLNLLSGQEFDKNSFYNVFSGASGLKQLYLIPLAFGYTLLNPFILWPFLDPDPTYNLLLPGIIFWYGLLPFVFNGVLSHLPTSRWSAELLVVMLILLMLAISGAGTIAVGRFRVPIQPLLVIFGVHGIQRFSQRKTDTHATVLLYFMVLALVVLAYLWNRL